MTDPSTTLSPTLRRCLAWSVHLLTASGAAFGAFALVRLAQGDLTTPALLMLLTLAIDSVDGTLARAVGVSEVLPHVDGRRLDDIVDYLTFVIVPVVFMVQAGCLLSWHWAAAPIVASAYGFSRDDAKTEDDFFLGFPSYWNVVGLYAWMLELSPLAGTLWVVALSICVFIPLKFIYPSKMKSLRTPTLVAGVVWGLLFSGSILERELADRYRLVEISLVYVAYYCLLSFWMGGIRRRVPAVEP